MSVLEHLLSQYDMDARSFLAGAIFLTLAATFSMFITKMVQAISS